MRTEDHLALGCYLLSQENVPQLRQHCIAFLIGCIEPDYNLLSYLRGILHHRKFRGHNAENSFAFLTRCRSYFEQHKASSAWDFFRLGAMLHYAADAFTWPHNNFWPGSLLEHVRYETALHAVFTEFLRSQPAGGIASIDEEALHEAYADAAHGEEADCRFIFAACSSLFRRGLGLAPAENAQRASIAMQSWLQEGLVPEAEAAT